MSNESCMNIVGPYVQKLRTERGWSLDQLADKFDSEGISVSRQTLEQIESQKEVVTEVDVLAFAMIFGTDVTQLFPPNPTSQGVRKELRRIRQNPRPSEEPIGFVLESLSASAD